MWLRPSGSRIAEPTGPPIEEIGARLRRLRRCLDACADPAPMPGKAMRFVATLLAYDRELVEACQALCIPQSLLEATGTERTIERLRVEAALEQAGLVLRTGSERTR
ncbi:MAG: hypothetical protein IRZ02_05950 [Acidothermus sp.]|nr:hypothetical protein [Acidothermus sp.]